MTSKLDGIRRSQEATSDENWLKMYRAVRETAFLLPTFNTDDVRANFPEGFVLRDGRHLGPVMVQAASDGLIEKDTCPVCGRFAEPVNRESAHGAYLTVWRSLILGKVPDGYWD